MASLIRGLVTMPDPERWTTTQAARYCGGVTPGRFRTLASEYKRTGGQLQVVDIDPKTRQNRYLADEVRAMQAVRPGQGKGGGRPAWKAAKEETP